jgi:cytochrome c oxidase assembly protein subunit 15
MAFTTYSLLLWTSLDLLNTTEIAKEVSKNLSSDVLKKAKRLRGFALLNGALVFSTVMSGAFVAGNDAGNAFNTFPMMDGKWIPDEILEMQPLWRNFFENTATVQFDHRVLALSTLGSIWTMYINARSTKPLWQSIPSYTRLAFNATTGISLIQVGLGISTLLLYVPVPLAAVHQAGSLTLLTSIICLVHSLKFSKFGHIITKLK